MNIYKGKILTLNEYDDVFNYLVEDKGTIIFTGNELPKVFCDWPYIDLKDGCLIPSFTFKEVGQFHIQHSCHICQRINGDGGHAAFQLREKANG